MINLEKSKNIQLLPKLIPYRKADKWGYCNKDKKIIIDCIFDWNTCFNKGFALITLNSKSGILKEDGTFVTEPIYDDIDYEAWDCWGNISKVENNKKFGLIDIHGNQVLNTEFHEIDQITEGLYRLRFNNKWAFFKVDNKHKSPFIYDIIGSVVLNEYLSIKVQGKWGVINMSGSLIIHPAYNNELVFDRNGLAFAVKDGYIGVINIMGEITLPIRHKFRTYTWSFQKNNIDTYFKCEVDKKCGIIDIKGNIIFQPVYDDIELMANGYAKIKNNDKWGLINKKNSVLIEPVFEDIGDMYKGFIAVKQNSKWGVINYFKEVFIPFEYDYVVFNEPSLDVLQWFKVCKNSKWGIINISNDVIIPVSYSLWQLGNYIQLSLHPNSKQMAEILTQYNGFEFIENDKIKVSKHEKWGIIDSNNNARVLLKYDSIERGSNGIFRISLNGKSGYINSEGVEYWED